MCEEAIQMSRTAVRDERVLGHNKQHKVIREIRKKKKKMMMMMMMMICQGLIRPVSFKQGRL